MVRNQTIMECDEACSCSKNCTNRVLQQGPVCKDLKLLLFRTDPKFDRGFGVRTLVDIRGGSYIADYRGEFITQSESSARNLKEPARINYTFSPIAPEDLQTMSPTLTPLNIDGMTKCSVARFVNHAVSKQTVLLITDSVHPKCPLRGLLWNTCHLWLSVSLWL